MDKANVTTTGLTLRMYTHIYGHVRKKYTSGRTFVLHIFIFLQQCSTVAPQRRYFLRVTLQSEDAPGVMRVQWRSVLRIPWRAANSAG